MPTGVEGLQKEPKDYERVKSMVGRDRQQPIGDRVGSAKHSVQQTLSVDCGLQRSQGVLV
jgi:hypothetical protein